MVLSLLFFNGFPPTLKAQEIAYRIYLHSKTDSLQDKQSATYCLKHPDQFLSNRALQRRKKLHIEIDPTDLPISESYLNQFRKKGKILTKSKWLATVVLLVNKPCNIQSLTKLPFVKKIQKVWEGQTFPFIESNTDTTTIEIVDTKNKKSYGYGEKQIKMLNGIWLHHKGYQGKGMQIAILDEGFENTNRIALLNSIQIIGTRNLVHPKTSVFANHTHGTKVLSCLAANAPYYMIGSAPQASYWLIKTEMSGCEAPIEEDFWVAGAEFADSVGVDVISSSLGYSTFDKGYNSYKTTALGKNSAFISIGAQKAEKKGLLVVCSAGNEGNSEWERITFPADAATVFTVGSIDEKKRASTFSSIGYFSPHKVKPNVVALGTLATIIDYEGHIRQASGTSYATPILAGMATCLWQAFPKAQPLDIRKAIEASSNRYHHPDNKRGYGLPNMHKAFEILRKNVTKQ
ncbi:MAG: S8 family serine peptidase [Massilibacteroides sp.]|nr:S8 family serine peptidase [Massilibacteroides sp.]